MNGLGPPWSSQVSLQQMVEDVGGNFDKFIYLLSVGRADEEIAAETGISVKTIGQFREHFEQYGIDSVMGQD
ncbi:MAG: helix-turn-helix domain-containing protein [Syntrophaceticus sp.]|nr:helix-turn-helix domain-containing protein [Syntrophaceticus sp.]MDD3314746.1 helix-turn-helix domain-containing protein [Syntrophaceticus sp.]